MHSSRDTELDRTRCSPPLQLTPEYPGHRDRLVYVFNEKQNIEQLRRMTWVNHQSMIRTSYLITIAYQTDFAMHDTT